VCPNNGTITIATSATDCSKIEIVNARRFVFRSRVFCSASPSIKQLPSTPNCSGLLFSSPDISHLSQNVFSSEQVFLPRRQMQVALHPPAQRSQGCEVRASSP
jgi:hypothetical protein